MMSKTLEPVVVLDSHSHVLHSDIVDDDYQLSVLPPPSYSDSSDHYPTLYDSTARSPSAWSPTAACC